MQDGHKRVCIKIVTEDMPCSLGIKPFNLGGFMSNADERKTKVARSARIPNAIPYVDDSIK